MNEEYARFHNIISNQPMYRGKRIKNSYYGIISCLLLIVFPIISVFQQIYNELNGLVIFTLLVLPFAGFILAIIGVRKKDTKKTLSKIGLAVHGLIIICFLILLIYSILRS